MKVALFLLLYTLPALSQTFKGNSIGMPLEEFKQANRGQKVYINTGDPAKRRNKKLDQAVDTPMCTDSLDGFDGANTGYRLPGEIICNISPGDRNPDAKLVAGISLNQVLYHFYGGRLYSVDISFSAISYLSMRNAFVSKFGSPSSTGRVDCQNGFGARWTGETVAWQIGQSAGASLVEGCGNGPGQNAFDAMSGGSISDSSMGPPRAVQKAADF
jgi:hypothetical protein